MMLFINCLWDNGLLLAIVIAAIAAVVASAALVVDVISEHRVPAIAKKSVDYFSDFHPLDCLNWSYSW